MAMPETIKCVMLVNLAVFSILDHSIQSSGCVLDNGGHDEELRASFVKNAGNNGSKTDKDCYKHDMNVHETDNITHKVYKIKRNPNTRYGSKIAQQNGKPSGYQKHKQILPERRRMGTGSTPEKPATQTIPRRTAPQRVAPLKEECDYLAYYCLRAYRTGPICGRTLYFKYENFKNYCMLDYVNCMERYEVWQVVHMGDCFNITPIEIYQHYEYADDSFLDEPYVDVD